jgi:hypothetical protein
LLRRSERIEQSVLFHDRIVQVERVFQLGPLAADVANFDSQVPRELDAGVRR